MGVPGITESSRYLTFTLDEELFALEIAKVREVLELVQEAGEMPPMRLPRAETSAVALGNGAV